MVNKPNCCGWHIIIATRKMCNENVQWLCNYATYGIHTEIGKKACKFLNFPQPPHRPTVRRHLPHCYSRKEQRKITEPRTIFLANLCTDPLVSKAPEAGKMSISHADWGWRGLYREGDSSAAEKRAFCGIEKRACYQVRSVNLLVEKTGVQINRDCLKRRPLRGEMSKVISNTLQLKKPG